MYKFKKLWLFLLIFGLAFVLLGCNSNGNDDDDDGDDPIKGTPCSTDMNQEKCYDPDTFDWELNRSKYNGNKRKFRIMVSPDYEYDPFHPDYSGDRQSDKQQWQLAVEAAYNITIEYVNYPNEAAWGPSRVQWITDAHTTGEYRGDVFLIDSNWIPTLIRTGSIAELQNQRLGTGLYSDLIKFQQHSIYTTMTSVQNKTYGYIVGEARPDHYLYYNQDLIDDNGLLDPATLWNEGKWDWSTFTDLLETAQNAFSTSEETMYAMGGDYAEVAIGMVVARGGRFINQQTGQALMANPTVVSTFTDLQGLYDDYWEPLGSTVVSADFLAGNVLFNSGKLWFLKSPMRMGTAEFEVSLVPYPTLDGDASARDIFKIPLGFSSVYAISPDTSKGITPAVALNILDDLIRGLKPEIAITEVSPNDRYRVWLEQRINSEASINAVMSVQNEKYYHLELLETVSMTVGNGSHYTFTDRCFYPFASTLIKNENDTLSPQAELERIQPYYQAALETIMGDR